MQFGVVPESESELLSLFRIQRVQLPKLVVLTDPMKFKFEQFAGNLDIPEIMSYLQKYESSKPVAEFEKKSVIHF